MTLAKNSYGNAFNPQRWAEGQIILFGQSRIVDHHHRTSPNNLAELRPNIASGTKNLEVEVAESFFDFYILELSRLTSTAAGTDYTMFVITV